MHLHISIQANARVAPSAPPRLKRCKTKSLPSDSLIQEGNGRTLHKKLIGDFRFLIASLHKPSNARMLPFHWGLTHFDFPALRSGQDHDLVG